MPVSDFMATHPTDISLKATNMNLVVALQGKSSLKSKGFILLNVCTEFHGNPSHGC